MTARHYIIILFTLFMVTSCTYAQTDKESNDKPLHELVKSRRSVRRYTKEKIDRAALKRILHVAQYAPSSYGNHTTEFVVVEDKEMLKKLAACKRIGAPSVAQSAATIVVITDTTAAEGELWVEDASVSATYLLLAAEAEGLGACWNQIHLRRGQKYSASDEIKALLDIPDRFEVLCYIALGHKIADMPAHNDSELDFDKQHFGYYGKHY